MIIPIRSDTRNYDILLENGALSHLNTVLDLKRKVLVVTDSGVPKEFAEKVAEQCETPALLTISMGEQNKNFETYQTLLEAMLANDFTRGDCVVAVGGGVVGDLSGFAASCYMRGIDFYNIPTTLLSQVDSSIGGKTAIDFHGVKNTIGAFYNPMAVVIDPETLRTMDRRQLHAGLAEAIKMAATSDRELFELIERSTDLEADLPTIIYRALLIKKQVVEEDPREKGVRRVLNFGHTVGHAVETYYGGAWFHGECVALGMLPMAAGDAKARLAAILKKYDLPTAFDGAISDLREALTHDKKRERNVIRTVFTEKIGTYSFIDRTPDEILAGLEQSL